MKCVLCNKIIWAWQDFGSDGWDSERYDINGKTYSIFHDKWFHTKCARKGNAKK